MLKTKDEKKKKKKEQGRILMKVNLKKEKENVKPQKTNVKEGRKERMAESEEH